jgi:hypothetical protein
MTEKQWVNLDKEADYEADGMPLDRIGPVTYQWEFENESPSDFQVAVVESGGKPWRYTQRELSHGRFKLKQVRSQQNAGKNRGKVTEMVFLPAAGGTEWKIKAQHKGKVKEGGLDLVAWRKLWVQLIGLDGRCQPAPLGPALDVFADAFIDVAVEASPATTPERDRHPSIVRNLMGNDKSARNFAALAARGAWGLEKRESAAVAALFVHSIASREEVEFEHEVEIGSRLLAWTGSRITYELKGDKLLWFGVDSAHDAQNGRKGLWFMRCSLFDGDREIEVPAANVDLDRSRMRGPTSSGVTIEVPAAARRLFTRRKLRLVLEVRCIKGWSAGYSEPRVNLIVLAKEGNWQAVPPRVAQLVFTHELGHKIGMLPEGANGQLDRPGWIYGGRGTAADQRGHQGPHCTATCNYVQGRTLPDGTLCEWQGEPNCTMFGATGCYDPFEKNPASRWKTSPLIFCGNCKDLVRRLDLHSEANAGLKNSVRNKLPC